MAAQFFSARLHFFFHLTNHTKNGFLTPNNETSHCFSHTKAWIQIVKITLSCKLIFKRVDRAIFTTELTFLGQILKCSETCQLCSRVSNKTDDLTSRVNFNLPWFLEVQKTGASSDDVGLVDTKTLLVPRCTSPRPWNKTQGLGTNVRNYGYVWVCHNWSHNVTYDIDWVTVMSAKFTLKIKIS